MGANIVTPIEGMLHDKVGLLASNTSCHLESGILWRNEPVQIGVDNRFNLRADATYGGLGVMAMWVLWTEQALP